MIRGIVFFLSMVMILSGCGPRGETRTLEELLQDSSQRFAASQQVKLAVGVSGSVARLAEQLQSALNLSKGETGSELKTVLSTIGSSLGDLTPTAGYTSRPALGELSQQYLQLGGPDSDGVSAEQVSLLVSRTYNLLASELETNRFSYSSSG